MFRFADDETMIVPKLEPEPTRRLPQQFAPARKAVWPWILIALAALVALGGRIDLDKARRAHAAHELARTLDAR